MKKSEIKVGGIYEARVSGRFVQVRVDTIREQFDHKDRSRTVFDVTNLTTSRKLVFHSAQKFRGVVKRFADVEETNRKALEAAAGGDSATAESLMRNDELGKTLTKAFKQGEKEGTLSAKFVDDATDPQAAMAEVLEGGFADTQEVESDPTAPAAGKRAGTATAAAADSKPSPENDRPFPQQPARPAPTQKPSTTESSGQLLKPLPSSFSTSAESKSASTPATSTVSAPPARLDATTNDSPLASLLRKSIDLQHEREDIIESPPHVVIEARAGTGKTFTEIVGVGWAFGQARWPQIVRTIGERLNAKRSRQEKAPLDLDAFDVIPSPEQRLVWEAMALSKGVKTVTYSAFNKSIVTEFGEEWGWLVELLQTLGVTLQFATINSLGNRAVYKRFGKVDVKDWHTENLVAERLGRDPREIKHNPRDATMLDAVCEIVGLCKLTLAGWNEANGFDFNLGSEEIDKIVQHYDIEMNGQRERVYDLIPQILEMSLDVESRREIDFDDQNWLPVVLGLPIPQVDLLLVDEGQDLPRCKQEFARKLGKRIILVGDPAQACYGFAGADTDSIPRMKVLLGNGTPLEPLRLTQTRRCGKAIVAEAAKIVPDFSAHDTCPDGKIIMAVYEEEKATVERPHYMTLAQDKDMVVCRVNAPLVGQALRFIKAGRKAVLRGRDFGGQLKKFIEKLGAKKPDDLLLLVEAWYANECKRENAKRNPSEMKLASLSDKMACVLAFADDAETMADVHTKLDNVFAGKVCPKCGKHYNETADRCSNRPCQTGRDLVTGYPVGPALVTPAGVLFSSIHRAKGLEANRVFFLRPKGAECPHPMAKLDWEKQQEKNLTYIALTRARDELVYVS